MPNTAANRSPVKRVRGYFIAHKTAGTVALLVVAAAAWWSYARLNASPAVTLYVLGSVQQGTIASSVTGSGQVLASDQVTVYPQASGQITAVYIHDGQQVSAGQALAQIDDTTALQAVTNAQSSLQSAQLALQKLQEPATQLSLTQAQNTLASAQETQITDETNLRKDYQTGYNDAAATYLDLPTIMNSLQDILYGTKATHGLQANFDYYENVIQSWDPNAVTYHDAAIADYQAALAAYNKALADYQTTEQNSSTSTIEMTMYETYSMAQTVSTALADANTFVNDYETVLKNRNLVPSTIADSALTSLSTYIPQMNTHISTLLSDENSLTSDQQAVLSDQRSIVENQQSLAQLVAGADPIDVQTDQLSIQQKQIALTEAQQTLADYTIRAPFSGALGNVDLHKGDTVGSGTAVAVEVSAGDIADLSLNEVDAAKVAVGQQVSLTFDAINGLTIAGHVASISPVGTVSQGVVSYDVKIGFDTQDSRVKSGMTVNAAIITAVSTNALVVPSSAVKTSGNTSTVQIVNDPPAQSLRSTAGVALATAPQTVVVTVGITNDTQTQILSGLAAGQTIVTRTTNVSTASTQTSTAPSLFGGGGGRFHAGG